jgi:hypothetical protein
MPDRSTEETRRVKITALGQHAHTTWFIHRLQAQGIQVAQTETLPGVLQQQLQGAEWSGLLVDDILLDTASSGLTQRRQLAEQCRQQNVCYAEMAGNWLSYGVQHGFPLFVGAQRDSMTRLQPLFDLLAPQNGIWLYCGPAGAGYYVARTFAALSQTAIALQSHWSVTSPVARAVDWQDFLQKQQQLAGKLLQLARLYLSGVDETAAPDPWIQLQAFSQPPCTQAHFAGNLARLIVLALEQQQAQQEIFQQLMERVGSNLAANSTPQQKTP